MVLPLHAMMNIFSSHLVALFNNISVLWHCVGVLVIIGVLIDRARPPSERDFVFTERINNSGFAMGMSGLHPADGMLLTMYTVTGYDAWRARAEETRDAEISAAKGVWQSVALSLRDRLVRPARDHVRGVGRRSRQRRRLHLAGDLQSAMSSRAGPSS